MSDLNVALTLRVDKENLSNQISVSNVTASMAVAGFRSEVYLLAANTSAVSTANLSTVGMAFLQNLSTSTVQTAQVGIISAGTFVPFTTLRSSEPAILRLTAGTVYAARGGANARLRVDITEG
jgi:hypothetical protein